MDDYGDDYADDEEYETQIGEVMGSASQALSPISAEERNLLKQLSEYATKTSLRPDCKAQTLINWLKQTLKPGGKWNEERVILFTEYRATQKWLYDLLARDGFAEERRLEMIYGGMAKDEREPIKAAFQTHPKQSAVRILSERELVESEKEDTGGRPVERWFATSEDARKARKDRKGEGT
jgi:ERCC4-related helicase